MIRDAALRAPPTVIINVLMVSRRNIEDRDLR